MPRGVPRPRCPGGCREGCREGCWGNAEGGGGHGRTWAVLYICGGRKEAAWGGRVRGLGALG